MGRSQESFGKKEREKKRLKKKQDKEKKKEGREKSNMDDMIAYVDEFGAITTTPPEMQKKRVEVKVEDIRIGVPRQLDEPEDPIRKGVVTFYNESKGYGFIKDSMSGDSVFFHLNGLLQPVRERDEVSFETDRGLKGINDIKVKLVGKDSEEA